MSEAVGPVVLDTGEARVTGLSRAGVLEFRGLKYAEAPRGALRFRPPQPVRLASDIDATRWGPRSPQPSHSSASLAAVAPKLYSDAFGPEYAQPDDEDSLRLHVWTAVRDPAKPRSVMVWLHGGGFDHGSAATPRTNGAALAAQHEVVVVSISHRLGALGYLYLEGVHPSHSLPANAGMHDIVAGLQWIADNIRAFGGDPGNVTVFGESGGGCKASTLLAMPAARGLVHRVILQSTPFEHAPTLEEATRSAHLLLAELEIGTGSSLIRRLETVDPREVAEVQERLVSSGILSGLAFSPVLDGRSVIANGREAVVSSELEVLIGINDREYGSFALGDSSLDHMDDTELADRVAGQVGGAAPGLIDAYRSQYPSAAPRELWVRMVGHRMLMLPAQEIIHARRSPTFSYLFDWTSPHYPDAGAFHGIEGGFVFSSYPELPFTSGAPEVERIASETSSTWVSFAGDGALRHPALDHEARSGTLRHGTEPAYLNDPFAELYHAWKTALASSRN